MIDVALERIAEKLRLARRRGVQPFGVESHGMRINPPLSEQEVAAIEARLGVALPEEYRGFVTRVGDGGAGPAYGMVPLAEALRRSGIERVPELLARRSARWSGTSRRTTPSGTSSGTASRRV